MSIASRISAMQEHLRDDYDVLTLAGADLTNVDKNILNLKSTWQERLLYFINNGTDVVWNNWDKVTGEGTILTLNNTEEAPMKINLKGNTSQNTTTGKNLLDITLTSQTKNGVNITVNEDNSITLSGTATSGLTLNLNYTSGKYINLTSGETYTISIKNNNGVYLRLAKVSDNSNVATFDNPRTSVTFTSNYTGDCFVYLAILNNTTLNNLTIYPMIEKGSSETSFEPYTNGASPNPDYPQDVNVVSGDNTIEVVGKNLAPTDWATDFVSRINDNTKAKLEVVDGKNCLFYAASAGYQEYDTKYMFKTNWKENTQYTFRLNVKPSNANIFNLTIAYTDGTSQRIDATTGANTWSTYTKFTSYANKTIKYLRVNWSAGSDYIDLDTFMVYEGTETLPYEPYQSQSYAVNLGTLELCKIGNYQDRFIRNSGKNLFNKEVTTFDGYVANDGTETLSANFKTSDYIPIEPNTTYATGIMTNSGSNPSRCYYDENKTFISGEKHFGATTVVGTSPNNAKYMRESIPVVDIDKVQIEKGNSISSYEPYGNGDWYLEKKIGKVVLDGETDGLKFTSAEISRNKRFSLILSDVLKQSYLLNIDNKSNNFTYNTDVYRDGGDEIGFIINSTQLYVRFGSSSELDTITKANTWLSTHNTIFYYILATPTYTKIEGTLESQLNALSNAKSYNSQTNISQNNTDLPFIINATALKEMA